MSKNDVVNVACPCTHKGRHYPGFTIHKGVNIVGFEPAGCGIPRTQIKFENTDIKPTGIFVEGVSGADISDNSCHDYLQLTLKA